MSRDTIHAENVPGPLYVSDACINCGLCPELAPSVFRESTDRLQAIVHSQPADLDSTRDAMDLCPTEAIRTR